MPGLSLFKRIYQQGSRALRRLPRQTSHYILSSADGIRESEGKARVLHRANEKPHTHCSTCEMLLSRFLGGLVHKFEIVPVKRGGSCSSRKR